MRKKEWIAMLLAGGQGSRLYSLNQKPCKTGSAFRGKIPDHRLPAVELCEFWNRYRWRSHAVPTIGAQRIYRKRPTMGFGPTGRRRFRTARLTRKAPGPTGIREQPMRFIKICRLLNDMIRNMS